MPGDQDRVHSAVPHGPAEVGAAGTPTHKLALDNQDLRFEVARLQASLLQKQGETIALTGRCGVLRDQCEALRLRCGELEREVDNVRRSFSWRLTSPLRRLRGLVRRE